MSRRRQKAPERRLKTLDDISAAEELTLFQEAWVRDPSGRYRLIIERVPQDIAAKDYMKDFLMYCALCLWSEEHAQPDEKSQTLTERDLEELFFRAPRQRKIVEVIRRNKPRVMSLDEIAVEVGGRYQSTKTIQNLLTRIFKKTNSKNLIELTDKLPPLRA